MNLAKLVNPIFKYCAERWEDDIPKATEMAVKRVKKLPEYPDILDRLVYLYCQEGIYDARHAKNTRIKNAAGAYTMPAQVVVGAPDSVGVAELSALQTLPPILELAIGGRSFGDLLGKELLDEADACEMRSNGEARNACLLRRTRPLVDDDQRVKDAITPEKAFELYQAAASERE